MRRVLAIGVLALVVAAPAGAAPGKKCRKVKLSDYDVATRIHAVNVGCKRARRVAGAYHEWKGSGSRSRLRGFHCRRRFKGYEAAIVRCHRGRKVVRFRAVAYA